MQWHHCGSLSVLYLLPCANALKLRTIRNTLFCEILCKVFWYSNMLTTHGSRNSLVRRQQSPEETGFGKCYSMWITDGHSKANSRFLHVFKSAYRRNQLFTISQGKSKLHKNRQVSALSVAMFSFVYVMVQATCFEPSLLVAYCSSCKVAHLSKRLTTPESIPQSRLQ